MNYGKSGEEIMEEEFSYFTAISQRVWTDYDKKEKELSGEVEVSEEKESLEEINGISETIPATNFRITDDELGQGTAKEKFRANIMAIQLLKKCEDENRNATPEEQEILSRYVGWGGLADAFDETKAAWETEYLELKAVLTPEEYAAARASTLNAHYTQPIVIEVCIRCWRIWDLQKEIFWSRLWELVTSLECFRRI